MYCIGNIVEWISWQRRHGCRFGNGCVQLAPQDLCRRGTGGMVSGVLCDRGGHACIPRPALPETTSVFYGAEWTK